MSNQHNSPMSRLLSPTPSGNVDIDQFKMSLQPWEIARLEAWARQLNMTINWGLPLIPRIYSLRLADIERESVDSDTRFNLDPVTFGAYTYVRAWTINIPVVQFFEQTDYKPDALFSGQLDTAQFVRLQLRRNNTGELFTSGKDSFLSPQHWMGDGKSPYEQSLSMLYTQGETLNIEGKVQKGVRFIDEIEVGVHVMELPQGAITVGG